MMVTRIGLDYDFPFEKFNTERFKHILEEEKIDNIDFIAYRESSNGRTHVRIHLNMPIPLFRSMMIRAQLGDDRQRIYGDLRRLGRQGNNAAVDVLFDETIKNGIHNKAGTWRTLTGTG